MLISQLKRYDIDRYYDKLRQLLNSKGKVENKDKMFKIISIFQLFYYCIKLNYLNI